jgi:hypothetical protein
MFEALRGQFFEETGVKMKRDVRTSEQFVKDSIPSEKACIVGDVNHNSYKKRR